MAPKKKRRPPAFAAGGHAANVAKRESALEVAERFRNAYMNALQKDPRLLQRFLKNPRDVDRLIAQGMVNVGIPLKAEKTIKNYRLGCIGGKQVIQPLRISPEDAERLTRVAGAAKVEELRKAEAEMEKIHNARENRILEEYARVRHKHALWGDQDTFKHIAGRLSIPPEEVQRAILLLRKREREGRL